MKASNSDRPVIVWFRDDLRLSDHPALHEAAMTGAPVICLYVLDEQSAPLRSQGRQIGAASRWWLAQSLKSLQGSLSQFRQKLVLRKGAAATVLMELCRQTAAPAVYWITSDSPAGASVEREVKDALLRMGVTSHISVSDLLAKPPAMRTKDGGGYRVFTPFWKRLLSLGDPPHPLPAPVRIVSGEIAASEDLESWNLEPKTPDWAVGLRETWQPGETAARARLAWFLESRIQGYATRRDRPDGDHTSRLSPHLRFGEISPRQIWHASRFAASHRPAIAGDVEKFLSELGWREFSRNLLHDNPQLAERNLQASFDSFSWRRDARALRAWQRGQTGYPIVDAGMRELWHTGIMHNRVRMVAASFLVKHLLIDWREGEKWFWDTLVDADPGSNPASWQWVAGCGADAAPYFRIFNPILQGEKFDPDGRYVTRWAPELAKLPASLIHRPWEATPLELSAAGVTLGQNYPEPLVDHKRARERALAAYAKTRH